MASFVTRSLHILAILSLTFIVVLGVPVGIGPSNPTTDPFYQPPAGFQSKPLGTILRQRSIVASFFGLIPDPVEAYQLLYRTTAINGSAIATVTTIFKPFGAMTDRFVSFHTAYDSSAPICDPSYGYQLGTPQDDLIGSAELLLIQAYLASGYIVASPDYEGPDAAFAAGRLAGMGVLDGMRAVTTFQQLGFSTNKPMVVGVGYSGGAIATGWAASLQPNYAPELPIKGWVQGGTPANLTGTMLFIDGGLFSGFLEPAVDGLSKPSAYRAQVQTLLNTIVTPAGQSKLAFANSNCAAADLLNAPEESILSTTFQTLGAGLLYNPIVRSILDQNIMGSFKNETPKAPVLLYHASQDEIIPYANASALVTTWCQNGASVKFTTFANGGHLTTEIVGLPDALEFTKAAFANAAPSGCSRNTELSNILNPLALGVELEPILLGLISLLAVAGEGDSNIISNLNTLNYSGL